MNGRLRIALAYAARGWPVLPLVPQSKVPLRRGGRGVYDATCDGEQIEGWYRACPQANIGIACGRASGLLVLDLDNRNDGGLTLGGLELAHGSLPRTPRALTGGGGTHFFFSRPDFERFHGSAGPGLDVKVDGGYVVAPPSVHPSGAMYRWDVGALPSETDLATVPSWLADRIRGDAVPTSTRLRPLIGVAAETYLARAFALAGWLGVELPDGKIAVRCPWLHEHGADPSGRVRGDGTDSSCVILASNSAAHLGAWRCLHAHCARRTTLDAIDALPVAAKAGAGLEYPAALAVASRRLARRRRTRAGISS